MIFNKFKCFLSLFFTLMYHASIYGTTVGQANVMNCANCSNFIVENSSSDIPGTIIRNTVNNKFHSVYFFYTLRGEEIEVDIININDVSCNGGSDGSALAVASGGVPPYIYNWSNGQTAALLSNVPAGSYTITVTDNTGDTGTATVTISQPPLLTLNITNQSNITCSNPLAQLTVQASGGTSPYSYAWSTGEFGTTIFVTQAGDYTATVTDNNQCTASVTISVQEDIEAPMISAGPDLSIECAGGQIQLLGNGPSGGQYNILWTTVNGNIVSGQNTYNPTVNQVGQYTLTVTNLINGCSSEDVASITAIAPALNVTIESSNISCFGANDGIANVNASGGTGNLSFAWSNGSNNQEISGLSPGIYTVTVTDVNGCSDSKSVTITQPPVLNIILNITHESGPGQNDGSASTVTTGGTPAYSYLWNTGDTTESIQGLEPGIYSVTVTDQNGCTANTSGEVLPYICEVIIDVQSFQFVTCFGGNDGSAIVFASGGQSPYQYLWSNGQTGPNLTNVAAGVYTVTATDEAGCSSSLNVIILQPDEISINLQITQMSGEGANDGMISATVTGGSGNTYTYQWSNGGSSAIIDNLSPGTYTLTVTDEQNCTATASGVINDINCMITTEIILVQPISCYGNNNAQINLVIEGQSGNINIVWNDGSNETSRTNLSPGNYSVTVTDEDNCVSTSSIIISQPDPLSISSIVENETVPGSMDGSITLVINGGTTPYSVNWSNGSNQNPLENLSEGVYQATVTDSNGCTASLQITVNSGDCSLVANFNINQVSCFGGTDGAIFTAVSGGLEPYVYLWSNGSTENSITNLVAGTYTVTINDQSDCDLIIPIFVTEPDSINIQILVYTNIIQTEGTGVIELQVSGGTPQYTFTWFKDDEFFSNQLSISDLESGNYQLIIVDQNGCTFNQLFIIELETSTYVSRNQIIGVEVYPNPTNESFNLKYDNQIKAQSITLYNLNGQLLKDFKVHSISGNQNYDVSALPDGVYFIKINFGQSSTILKLIICK